MKVEDLIGVKIWRRLPGNPDPHKVVGRHSTGERITADAVEMVMNDACLIDLRFGAGEYEQSNRGDDLVSVRTREVYELALKLYGAEPLDLIKRGAN